LLVPSAPAGNIGATASAKIIQNRDGTVTVRFGRVVAHTDVRGKTLAEAIELVRWAAIGSGISLSENMVWAALRSD
jgi:predicted GNAT family N-acyltransferase